MIKQDSVSLGFTVAALFLSMYWSTGEKDFIGLFPAILLFGGVTINYLSGYRFGVDTSTGGGRATNIVLYTLVALAGMYFTGIYASNYFAPQTTIQLSGIDAMEYGVLMAVSEEQFFRGGLLNFLSQRLGDWFAIFGSAAVFMVYHFFVYAGNNSALIYVFGGGVLLAFVTVKTQRLSPSILAHVINNILAAM
jgi:membrane protease YdiL (CAAX protease family)